MRRVLARQAGLTNTALAAQVRVSYAKVAEYQRRGVVHFHAIIRLDGPAGPTTAPPAWATLALLTAAIGQAARTVHLETPAVPGIPARTLAWGRELDTRLIATSGELTDSKVAAYVAKYATKAAECTGTLDRRVTPADQLDSILCARAYYTEPEPAGLRAYALLRDALERSGRVAIARVALRQRESLAALRSREGVMVLETLLWPDEIRVPDFEFLEQDIEVRSQELRMAASLIDSMTVDFDPSQYRDGYRDALEELVAAKMQGHEVVRPHPRAEEGGGSLADALRASLAAAKDTGGAAGPGRRGPRAGDAGGPDHAAAADGGGRKRPAGGTRKRQPRGKASA